MLKADASSKELQASINVRVSMSGLFASVFNTSTLHRNSTLKRPFVNQNYSEKWRRFLPIKITSMRVHQNNVYFSLITITSNFCLNAFSAHQNNVEKVRQNNIVFRSLILRRIKYVKMTWNFCPSNLHK